MTDLDGRDFVGNLQRQGPHPCLAVGAGHSEEQLNGQAADLHLLERELRAAGSASVHNQTGSDEIQGGVLVAHHDIVQRRGRDKLGHLVPVADHPIDRNGHPGQDVVAVGK